MVTNLLQILGKLVIFQDPGSSQERTKPAPLGLDEFQQGRRLDRLITGNLNRFDENAVHFGDLKFQNRLTGVLVNAADRLDFCIGKTGLLV